VVPAYGSDFPNDGLQRGKGMLVEFACADFLALAEKLVVVYKLIPFDVLKRMNAWA
jgi:hypothetical protein